MVVSQLQEREEVSYNNMLKLLRDGLEKMDLMNQDYTLLSPRVGVVSEAVNSRACDQEFIQRHVRLSNKQKIKMLNLFANYVITTMSNTSVQTQTDNDLVGPFRTCLSKLRLMVILRVHQILPFR